MTVVGLPNFLVSRRIRMRCCSFSISPQTHKSFGSPHVVQTSAMNLTLRMVLEIYKTFKIDVGFLWAGCRNKLATCGCVVCLSITVKPKHFKTWSGQRRPFLKSLANHSICKRRRSLPIFPIVHSLPSSARVWHHADYQGLFHGIER